MPSTLGVGSPLGSIPCTTTQAVAASRSPLQLLPPELLRLSMDFLTPRDVCTAEAVCQTWKRIITNDDNQTVWKVQHIRQSISQGIVPTIAQPERIVNYKQEVRNKYVFLFDADAWARYYGDPGGQFPVPKEILTLLQDPDPWEYEKTMAQTFQVVLMPSKVNGRPDIDQWFDMDRPLDVAVLHTLAGNPKMGFPTSFNPDCDYRCFKYSLIKIPVYGCIESPMTPCYSKPYWMLIRRGTLPGNLDVQHTLIRQVPQYRFARVTEIITNMLTSFVRSGKPPTTDNIGSTDLFKEQPWIVSPARMRPNDFNDGLLIKVARDNVSYGLTVVREFPIESKGATQRSTELSNALEEKDGSDSHSLDVGASE